jgi:hypothetical protein
VHLTVDVAVALDGAVKAWTAPNATPPALKELIVQYEVSVALTANVALAVAAFATGTVAANVEAAAIKVRANFFMDKSLRGFRYGLNVTLCYLRKKCIARQKHRKIKGCAI